LALTIESGEEDNPSWWLESRYMVYPDMKSNSGILMTLGKGAKYIASNKQKLNTKISTEDKLVVIYALMAQV